MCWESYEMSPLSMFAAGPTAPLNVNILAADKESITVGWAEPNPPHGNITSYDVAYWRAGDLTSRVEKLGVGRTRSSYQIRGLDSSVTYLVEVNNLELSFRQSKQPIQKSQHSVLFTLPWFL